MSADPIQSQSLSIGAHAGQESKPVAQDHAPAGQAQTSVPSVRTGKSPFSAHVLETLVGLQSTRRTGSLQLAYAQHQQHVSQMAHGTAAAAKENVAPALQPFAMAAYSDN